MAEETTESISVISGENFRKANVYRVTKILKGPADVCVYMKMIRNQKLIRWVQTARTITEDHLERINNSPNVYLCTLQRVEEPKTVFTTLSHEPADLEKTSFSRNERYDMARAEALQTQFRKETNVQALTSTRKAQENTVTRFAANEKTAENTSTKFSSKTTAQQNTVGGFSSKDRPSDSIDKMKSGKTVVGTVRDVSDDFETLRKPVSDEILSLYSSILDSPNKISLEEANLPELSNKILDIVAPHVLSIKQQLENIEKYSLIMNESTAILSIASLTAIAIGQRSKGVFTDLAYACLLMDISIAEKGREYQEKLSKKYALSTNEDAFYKNHPRLSYQVVQSKFSNLPVIVSQMVLGHHELFNGTGFPRRVRSEHLAPMVRVLAYAVDAYDYMRRAAKDGKQIGLRQTNEYFLSLEGPTQRRHSVALVTKVQELLDQST